MFAIYHLHNPEEYDMILIIVGIEHPPIKDIRNTRLS